MPSPLRFTKLHPGMILIWTWALLGLVFLPTNYRAGAATAHGHALLQLWADARDGRVQHHDASVPESAGSAYGWLNPLVTDPAPAQDDDTSPDIGEQNDSASRAGSLHFLAAVGDLPAADVASRPVIAAAAPLPAGRLPEAPTPPPRWRPAFT